MEYEYSDDYCRRFADVAESNFLVRMYPNDTIDGWHRLVESLNEGYDDVPPEFDSDIYIREWIEIFIIEKSLIPFPEHIHFQECIKQIDFKFLEVTQVHPQHNTKKSKLWEFRLPLIATKTYIEFLGQDYLKKYGITIILKE